MNYKNDLLTLAHILNNQPDIFKFDPRKFGLSLKESAYLFHPQSYHKSHRSGTDVGRRIMSFVRRNGKVRTNTKAWNQWFDL